jgi:hypothetical protein
MELSEDCDDDDDDDDDDDVRRSSSWVHVNGLTRETQQLTSAIVDFSYLSVLYVDRQIIGDATVHCFSGPQKL